MKIKTLKTGKLEVFLSVWQARQTSRMNMFRHGVLEKSLQKAGFEFEEVKASRKNVPELSFRVQVQSDKELDWLKQVAREERQESLLFTVNERWAYLIDGPEFKKSRCVGFWVQVTENEAKKEQAWTRLTNGEFYIVREFEKKEN